MKLIKAYIRTNMIDKVVNALEGARLHRHDGYDVKAIGGRD